MVDRRTTFVGLGNRDRGDDAFGLRFIDDLRQIAPKRFLSEEDGLESIILQVMTDADVEKIIFVDSCDFGAEPGSCSLLRLESIDETISTHKIPLSMLMGLLQYADKDTFLLGVQPESLEFNDDLSEKIEKVLKKLEIAVKSKL